MFIPIRDIIRESIERYLDEVKASDLKKRYPKHGDFIDKASSIIPNKYLEWVVNIVIASNVEPDLDKLSQVLKQFDDNVKRGKIKDEKLRDVSKWIKGGISFSDIDQANKQALEVKTSVEKKKEVKELGVKKWYDDNHYLVVEPKTVEASCYYGSGTKWCISAKESNAFREYYRKGIDFLFIINKKVALNDPRYKIALVVKDSVVQEIYDARDDKIYSTSDNFRVLEGIFGSFLETILEIVKRLSAGEAEEEGAEVDVKQKYGISRNVKVIARYMGRLSNAYYKEGEGWFIDDNVDFEGMGISLLPIFAKVKGYFDCSNNKLTSLAGAPQSVGGNFDCSKNKLTSLDGAPQSVGRSFYCYENELISLDGVPQRVDVNFNCRSNKLTSLDGAPQSVGGDFYCSDNELTSLEGAPQSVGGNFYCSDNELTSLEGVPQRVGGNFDCSDNELTSLDGAPQRVGGYFSCSDNKLTSLEGISKYIGGNFYAKGNPLISEELPLYVEISGSVILESLNSLKLRQIIKEQFEKVLNL